MKKKHIIAYYVNNVVKHKFPFSYTRKFVRFIDDVGGEVFGSRFVSKWKTYDRSGGRDYDDDDFLPGLDSGNERRQKPVKRRAPATMNVVEKLIRETGVKIVDITAPGFDKNMDSVEKLFGFNHAERCIVQLFFAVELDKRFYDIVHCMRNLAGNRFCGIFNMRDLNTIVCLTGLTKAKVESALEEDGVLLSSGVIHWDPEDGELRIGRQMYRALSGKQKNTDELKDVLLGDRWQGNMELDFSNVQKGYDYISSLIDNAVKKNIRGMNILIYGPTGTGKSEMTKQIVSSLGYALYGLRTENGRNKDKDVAWSYLMFAQRILANDKTSVVMVEEAEDVFAYNRFSSSAASKLFINQQLERNKRPVIWLTNDIGCMDPAYLRRFTYCFEFKKPDVNFKTKVWKNICKRHNFKIGDDEIARYAKKYDVSPGVIDSAVRVAKLTKLPNAIENTIDSMCIAMNGTRPSEEKEAKVAFDPSLLNTDTNIDLLTEQLKAGKSKAFSLCLYGASGTGKSAYARYLASQLGLKTILKRASDLKSKWVGETEKNIARAFDEAKEQGAMLIFDEADSFLRERGLANASWEVSAVNEMLTQMEHCEVPFVCTTNLMKDIDAASLRRFIFKIKYDFMTKQQVKEAFSVFFDTKVEDADIRNLDYLAPGDFTVVKNKTDILGIKDKKTLIEMLTAEMDVKNLRKGSKIGF